MKQAGEGSVGRRASFQTRMNTFSGTDGEEEEGSQMRKAAARLVLEWMT